MFDEQIPLFERRIEKFILRLEDLFYENQTPLKIKFRRFEGFERFDERLKEKYNSISPGQSWGKNWQRAWFHLTGQVPTKYKGKEVVAHLNLGGEGLLFDVQGVPDYALTLHTIYAHEKFKRNRVHLFSKSEGNEKVDMWFEVSAAELFGVSLENDKGHIVPKSFGRYEAVLEHADLAIFRRDLWNLHLDTTVLFDQMRALGEKNVRRARILKTLNRAIDQFSGDKITTAQASKIIKPLLDLKTSNSDFQTLAVGHAHLDTAWLWPLEETIRKCARTFATQLKLNEQYPEYIFGASQAQHYQFVKDHYPHLFDKIKKRIADGLWEVQGGMWVEADCNLISGESMVRQILYGKQFFRDEFDVDVRNLWIPDVFGYSAALPQILCKSGINSFITQKMSWNQFNKFPHHTFVWQGIDGSDVITHFPPEDNYNSLLSAESLIKARENFKEKAILDEFLTLFGIGDGGSGASAEMIETGLRQRDLEGSPRVVFGKAQDFIDRLSEKKSELPRWIGELYLELHRGTLTTHAYNKKMNRLMEHKLRSLEMLYSRLPFKNYPQEEIESIWKKVLLFQFHDIIPGSSITPVYEDTTREYKKLLEIVNQLEAKAGQLFCAENTKTLTIVNTSSYTYKHPIELPESWHGKAVERTDKEPLKIQANPKNTIVLTDLEPFEIVEIINKEEKSPSNFENPEKFVLENDLILYEFDSFGQINRAYDKEAKREVFATGQKGNVLALYEDRPNDWDAWDIDIFYENQLLQYAQLVEQKWIAGGPLLSEIEQTFKIGNSAIQQVVSLSANSKRLDFRTEVDWREVHKLLRVSFTVNVKATDANFDIQFGHLKRPTHRNTSWDMAKFEVAGQRFADLSENDYGVALLNDCKYGYKVLDNTLDLSLLRASTLPDPKADQGLHSFTYSLLPHQYDLIDSSVFSEAAQLNQPPIIFEGILSEDTCLPFQLENEMVVIDTIKKAEKENAIIVRLYEPRGSTATVKIKLKKIINTIFETDLLEDPIKPLETENDTLSLNFKPFDIITLKFDL